jgi:hypothetical protein
MQAKKFINHAHFLLAALFFSALFLIGCSSYARSTSVRTEGSASEEEYKADEFVGTPIMGDYDNNDDLDFVLGVHDGDRVFKINVHEDAGVGNKEILDRIRKRINEMEDRNTLRVIGYYSPEYKGTGKEYGYLELKCIVFFDDETGYEEAYFTDPKGSRFYDEGDVTVIYAPGHHLNRIYYPRFCTPWWDIDGDGIPNRYDPWPYTYDTWYDYNLNGFPDWYDPYYCDYYPYWNNWDLGFWVGYGWYSPSYFHNYYNAGRYYDDYRCYSRLYDRREVGSSRVNYHLDVKTEARWRMAQGNAPRASSAAADPRGRGYYSPRTTDSRMLVPTVSNEGGLDVKSSSRTASSGDISGDSFTRNRAMTYDTGETGRERVSSTEGAYTGKRKTEVPASAPERDYGTIGRSRTPIEGGSGNLTRERSSGDNRAYVPSGSSRERNSSSGNIAPSSTKSSGDYGRSREGTTPRADSPSIYDRNRTYTRERSSSEQAPSGSYSSPSRSRDTRSAPSPSATVPSSGRSRGSAPAPAARAPERSRSSSPAPSARSSGGSSRGSSSSGSSGKSSSSSGGGQRRR